MENDKLMLGLAELSGEVKAFREIFAGHTQQDMEQFAVLNASIEKVNEKLEALLLREARRDGEFSGVRRSAIVLATLISSLSAIISVALSFYVG